MSKIKVETEAEKKRKQIKRICSWMGWKWTDRGWQRLKKCANEKTVALYEPGNSFDPWMFREDLALVLVHVDEKRLSQELVECWMEAEGIEKEDNPIVEFYLNGPDKIMAALWKLLKW